MVKLLVIHHSADYDGLFSGAVALHWLSSTASEVDQHIEVRGWDFGDPVISTCEFDRVYVLDLPIECQDGLKPLIWIDHHASSIEKCAHLNIPGFQLDGVAACRLAWAYFYQGAHGSGLNELPTLQDFRERRVLEPLILTLVGEADVFDKSDPKSERLQFGLVAERCRSVDECLGWLRHDSLCNVEFLCEDGSAAMSWQNAFAEEVCRERGYMVELDKLKFWALCSVHCRSSLWFPATTIPEEADAIMSVRIKGDGQAALSLYHKPGREHLNLSLIASKYGGGGHRGACGFSVSLNQAITMGIVK